MGAARGLQYLCEVPVREGMMIVEIDWNVLMWGFENRMSDRMPLLSLMKSSTVSDREKVYRS
jgi:hypothetical protein